MQLVGSRTTENFDEFSDWDYQLESKEDFEEVYNQLVTATVSKCFTRGSLRGITIINSEGYMLDYSSENSFENNWLKLNKEEKNPKTQEFWILSFKHLKALFREFDVLSEIGIELSTGLARDIFFETKLNIPRYKDFFEYKKVHDNIVNEEKEISQVTGMPYVTREQKIAKIVTLNNLIASLTPQIGDKALQVFNERLKLLN